MIYFIDSPSMNGPPFKRFAHEAPPSSPSLPIPSPSHPLPPSSNPSSYPSRGVSREVYAPSTEAFDNSRQPSFNYYSDAKVSRPVHDPIAYSPSNDRMTFIQTPLSPPPNPSPSPNYSNKQFHDAHVSPRKGHDDPKPSAPPSIDADDPMEFSLQDFPDTPPPEHISAKEFLNQRLKLYGFKVKHSIPGDGNCQFASIADTLFNKPDAHNSTLPLLSLPSRECFNYIRLKEFELLGLEWVVSEQKVRKNGRGSNWRKGWCQRPWCGLWFFSCEPLSDLYTY